MGATTRSVGRLVSVGTVVRHISDVPTTTHLAAGNTKPLSRRVGTKSAPTSPSIAVIVVTHSGVPQ